MKRYNVQKTCTFISSQFRLNLSSLKSSPHATTVARRFSTKLRVQRATNSSSVGECNRQICVDWPRVQSLGNKGRGQPPPAATSDRLVVGVPVTGSGSSRAGSPFIAERLHSWPIHSKMAVTYVQTTGICRSLYTEFRRRRKGGGSARGLM